MRGTGTVVERTHPGLGLDTEVTIREIRQAGLFSDTPLRVAEPAPLFGQHTAEILTGLLGMSAEEVQQLEADAVVSTGHSSKKN